MAPLAAAILKHLTHRTYLTSAELQKLDLDGDGRVTARDFLLANRGKPIPPHLPLIVPTATLAGQGEKLVCHIRGKAPKVLSASIRAGHTGRIALQSETQTADRGRSTLTILLPRKALLSEYPQVVQIWLTAAGYLPHGLSLTLCPGPVIERVDRVKPGVIEIRGRGWSGKVQGLIALLGENEFPVELAAKGRLSVYDVPQAAGVVRLRDGERYSNVVTFDAAREPQRRSK